MFYSLGKGNYLIFLAILLSFLLQPVYALSASSAGQDELCRLTLEQAFRTAISQNPSMNQAAASRKKAASEVNRSIAAFLPKVNLQAGYFHSDNPVNVFGSKLNQADFTRQDFQIDSLNYPDYRDNWQARVIMTQPLFNQGREYIGYRTSKLMSDMSELGLTSTGQSVLYMVERAYCQALLAQEKVEVLKAALKTAVSHVKLSESRYQTGLVLKSDVLGAQVQKISTERALLKAENDFRIATAALNKAMGTSQEKMWHLEQLNNEKQDGGTLDSWLEQARKYRPEILMAKDQLKISEYGHQQAVFRFLPSFNLHGIYQQDRQNFADFGGDSWTLMATMSINLFNGFGDRAGISSALAEMEKKRARLREVENNIELQVRSAYYEFQTAQKQLKVMGKAVKQAEESQRILKKRYENGLALMVELLSADTSVRETKLQEARARFDARLAWSELRWKAGLLGRDLLSTSCSPSH
ncbi:MAG: hypothetical protein DSZ23_00255 [Thermodesulfatator sp.]|nr:MAG: hypothetical protein DSZ23_00255 [Thermodesulfatator sp.]